MVNWDELEQKCAVCTRCGLCRGRTNVTARVPLTAQTDCLFLHQKVIMRQHT